MVVPVLRSSLRLDSMKASSQEVDNQQSNKVAFFCAGQYYRVSRVKGMRSDPLCPFNTMEEPAGSTPLHQIFEEYAASQEAFARDFVPALEKMLSNGYNE